MLKPEFSNQGIERHSQVSDALLRTRHRIFVGEDDPLDQQRGTAAQGYDTGSV